MIQFISTHIQSKIEFYFNVFLTTVATHASNFNIQKEIHKRLSLSHTHCVCVCLCVLYRCSVPDGVRQHKEAFFVVWEEEETFLRACVSPVCLQEAAAC